ncbi:hypothetical protein KQX54_003388 [Cotesia glomerata]|uniref:Uncharacterized protein n=1 Tax=Cotesia glomerata TaxID=32391 RepID=A0AAV7HV07_COTGL|nr:hypothetical protein KQX54_003388 [Cotesia glomerata]
MNPQFLSSTSKKSTATVESVAIQPEELRSLPKRSRLSGCAFGADHSSQCRVSRRPNRSPVSLGRDEVCKASVDSLDGLRTFDIRDGGSRP